MIERVRPIGMDAVRSHPRVDVGGEPIRFVVAFLERIGDAAASGADTAMVPPTAALDGTGRVRINAIPCHARVVEVDGYAEVRARCADGEWSVEIFATSADTLRVIFPPVVDCTPEEFAAWCEEHERWRLATVAALHQRESQVRELALPVPVHAGVLPSVTSAGRVGGVRAEGIGARRIVVKRESEAREGRMRELVTVEMVLPKVRGMRLKLRAEEVVFPEFTRAPRSNLPQLVGETLAQRLPPRALQAVLAGMGIAYRERGVELDGGKVPDRFRTEVMRTMGMPSRSASQRQRDMVREALDGVLVPVEFHVKPQRKSGRYLPLLVATEYAEPHGGGERSAVRLAVNPEIMGDMDGGRRMLVPEAVLQIGDDDRDGVLALLALQLAFRLGMGTREKHEKLELMLRRAGAWEWCQRTAAQEGAPHVMRTLREGLDKLRALPWLDHAPADVVGGTMIDGDSLKSAVVVYREPPAWVRSSP
jgi:hypothetical protein